MKYNITQYDKDLLLQSRVDFKYKLLVINNNDNIVNELTSINSIGSYSVDSESNIRRTTSFEMFLDDSCKGKSIEKYLFEWIGLTFKLMVGIYSLRDDDYKWYDCGYYLITEANTSYDATTNSISTSLSDWYSKLDGTRNGQIGGAPTIEIPNVDENGKMMTIKQIVTLIIRQDTGVKKYIIDDIGHFYGMPENNDDYLNYRKMYPDWNQLPYDLKYEAGCNISDILEEINNLYPNCQMYFDIYNNFCFNMIPSCEYDPIELSNDYLQQIIVAENSESVTYNIKDIKNITEVFGKDFEVDLYADSCTSSSNVYNISIESYETYVAGDIIAFTPTTTNLKNSHIKINTLSSIPLYYEYTKDYVDSNLLLKNETYVIQIKYVEDSFVAYYLGQYQPHALCVLTNDINDSKYTKEYFAQKYNCSIENVMLRVEKNNPFAVQKIGEILDVKSGSDYENIISGSVAMENAIYYNKISSSTYDTVTLTTMMIPFLDVNTKVEYKKQQDIEINQYIIKSITHNMDSFTSDIVMYRFYPLYFE